MMKCADLMIHVFGYKKCKQANWFRDMINDTELVVNTDGVYWFTKQGVFTAIMKTKEPKDKQRYQQICDELQI